MVIYIVKHVHSIIYTFLYILSSIYHWYWLYYISSVDGIVSCLSSWSFCWANSTTLPSDGNFNRLGGPSLIPDQRTCAITIESCDSHMIIVHVHIYFLRWWGGNTQNFYFEVFEDWFLHYCLGMKFVTALLMNWLVFCMSVKSFCTKHQRIMMQSV